MIFSYNLNPQNQPNNGQPNQTQPMPPPIPIGHEELKKLFEAQSRTELAVARQNEIQPIMQGLAEIRMALNFPAIQEGDQGSGERPAIKPIFSEDNQKKLQTAYLNLWMRYAKVIDHIIQSELKMPTPNKDIDEK